VKIHLYENESDMGAAGAARAAHLINEVVQLHGEANIILATGASQFETLRALVGEPVDWSKVSVFHLDEYIGLPSSHPASFRNYLHQRFVDKLPNLRAFYAVNGEGADPAEECHRLGEIIGAVRIDLACVGIGENGHLAFNDPPADFETEEPFIIVNLDRDCRKQQVGEGWFSSIEDVPTSAISMSIRQIMKSNSIICTVPDRRKAEALKNAVEGDVSNMVPASILQRHRDCHVFADEEAGSLLSNPKDVGATQPQL
jgi:glucosamine-6-phosphate deaminase